MSKMMESEIAIGILNEINQTGRLHYEAEYTPLINALHTLAAYEGTGLSPEQVAEMIKSVTVATKED